MPYVLHKQRLEENVPEFRIVVCMEIFRFGLFLKASKAALLNLMDLVGYLKVLLFLCQNAVAWAFFVENELIQLPTLLHNLFSKYIMGKKNHIF